MYISFKSSCGSGAGGPGTIIWETSLPWPVPQGQSRALRFFCIVSLRTTNFLVTSLHTTDGKLPASFSSLFNLPLRKLTRVQKRIKDPIHLPWAPLPACCNHCPLLSSGHLTTLSIHSLLNSEPELALSLWVSLTVGPQANSFPLSQPLP